jgi:hypothetical protein
MADIFVLQNYRNRLHPAQPVTTANASPAPVSVLTQACRTMSDSVLRMRAASQQIALAAADLRDLAREEC